MRLSLVVLLLHCCGFSGAARASASDSGAHTALEQGIALSLDAEFEQALTLFDALLARAALSAEERTQLLSERSLVLFALGRELELAENLRQLAELSPETRLSERAPPALLARWQAVAAGAREAQAAAAAEPVTILPAVALTVHRAAPAADREVSVRVRRKRGFWIGGAAAVAAAALVTALALTLPSTSSGRTAVKPNVEF
jgi:hypothetical protein